MLTFIIAIWFALSIVVAFGFGALIAFGRGPRPASKVVTLPRESRDATRDEAA